MMKGLNISLKKCRDRGHKEVTARLNSSQAFTSYTSPLVLPDSSLLTSTRISEKGSLVKHGAMLMSNRMTPTTELLAYAYSDTITSQPN